MKRIIARVLVDLVIQGLAYKVDQVVDLPENLAKPHVADGSIDASPDAVDYCRKELKSPELVHEDQAVKLKQAELDAVVKQLEELRPQFEAETDAAKKAELGKQGQALHDQAIKLRDELAELQGGK